MTNQQIIKKFESRFPEYTVIKISRMPFGAYIYAAKNNSSFEYVFTIDF